MRMRLAVVVGVLPVGVAEVGHRNRKKEDEERVHVSACSSAGSCVVSVVVLFESRAHGARRRNDAQDKQGPYRPAVWGSVGPRVGFNPPPGEALTGAPWDF